jgi:transient receptor potential cation channel subfamily A protein 1
MATKNFEATDMKTAVTAISALTNAEASTKRARKKRQSKQQISLEVFKNLSSEEYQSPFQLAAEGKLEELKTFIEAIGSVKERDENGATLIHHAAASNQIAIMQYLVQSTNININAVDNDGNTALHLATKNGHSDAIHLLLQSRANDTILNSDKDAPLHIATRANNAQAVEAFLQHPTVDIVITGKRKRTPLHIVSELDHIETLQVYHSYIIAQETFKKVHGFRLCAKDEDELTPLHLAARSGSHRVLEFLISNCMKHNYRPEIILSFLDEENSTPLHAAIDGGHLAVVKVLLRHGAKADIIKDQQPPPFILASSQGKLEMMKAMLELGSREVVSCKDIYGQTALHRCTQSLNCAEIMCFLIESKAEVDAIDNKGRTPLTMAITAGSLTGVKVLLCKGANACIKDFEGCNALHHAVTCNRKLITQHLLGLPCASSLVTDVENNSLSPIHYALKESRSTLVALMVSVIKNQLKNIKDSLGNNYLHLAAHSGDAKALSILLDIPECHKLLNETNNYGGTPLHVAASQGHIRSTEILLAHGAMVHKCSLGHTPFMFACYKGQLGTAKLVYKSHPYQLNWADDKKNTPLHVGALSGNPQMITFLLDIGAKLELNFANESFFDNIVESNDEKCAMAVVNHERWQECLDFTSPCHPHPMISLISRMPKVAKVVLDRSHTKAECDREHADYWERYDFKYLQVTEMEELHDDSGSKASEMTPLMDYDDKHVMVSPQIHYKGSIKKASAHPSLKLNKRASHLDVLRGMIRYNRASLLAHPVTENYLKAKWRNYGKWIHIIGTLLTLLQVILLVAFTLLAPRPYIDSTTVPVDNCTNNVTLNSNINATSLFGDCTEEVPIMFSLTTNIVRFVTLAVTLLNLIQWLVVVLKIRLEALNFVRNTFVLVDGLAVAFTAIYLIPWSAGGLHIAIWEAGAIASFFVWFSLILKVQLFDLFGVYVTMFITITRSVFQVLVIFFLFICAFALSFYILAGNLHPFSTIGYSFFTNFAHLLGEIDYNQFIEASAEGILQFDTLTFFFVILLAILMSIVVMNLLIGIAVGDIEQIRQHALTEKRILEVKVFTRLDSLMPGQLLQRFSPNFYIKYPNKRVSCIKYVWRFFWHTIKGQDPSIGDTEDNESANFDDGQTTELSHLRQKVEELSEAQDKMIELVNQIHVMQQEFMKKISKIEEYEEKTN